MATVLGVILSPRPRLRDGIVNVSMLMTLVQILILCHAVSITYSVPVEGRLNTGKNPDWASCEFTGFTLYEESCENGARDLPLCDPGKYKRQECIGQNGDTTSDFCDPCEFSTFQTSYNNCTACHPCSECRPGETVKEACSADVDTICEKATPVPQSSTPSPPPPPTSPTTSSLLPSSPSTIEATSSVEPSTTPATAVATTVENVIPVSPTTDPVGAGPGSVEPGPDPVPRTEDGTTKELTIVIICLAAALIAMTVGCVCVTGLYCRQKMGHQNIYTFTVPEETRNNNGSVSLTMRTVLPDSGGYAGRQIGHTSPNNNPPERPQSRPEEHEPLLQSGQDYLGNGNSAGLYEPIPTGGLDPEPDDPDGASVSIPQESPGQMEPIYAKVDKTKKESLPTKSLPTGTANEEGVTIRRNHKNGDLDVEYTGPKGECGGDASCDIPFMDEEEVMDVDDPEAGEGHRGSGTKPSSKDDPLTETVDQTCACPSGTAATRSALSNSKENLDASVGGAQEHETKSLRNAGSLAETPPGALSAKPESKGDSPGESFFGGSSTPPGALSAKPESKGDSPGDSSSGGSSNPPDAPGAHMDGALKDTIGAETNEDSGSPHFQERHSNGSIGLPVTVKDSPSSLGATRDSHDPQTDGDDSEESSINNQGNDLSSATPGSEDVINVTPTINSQGATDGAQGDSNSVESCQHGDPNAAVGSSDSDNANGATVSNSTNDDNSTRNSNMGREGVKENEESNVGQMNPDDVASDIFLQTMAIEVTLEAVRTTCIFLGLPKRDIEDIEDMHGGKGRANELKFEFLNALRKQEGRKITCRTLLNTLCHKSKEKHFAEIVIEKSKLAMHLEPDAS